MISPSTIIIKKEIKEKVPGESAKCRSRFTKIDEGFMLFPDSPSDFLFFLERRMGRGETCVRPVMEPNF